MAQKAEEYGSHDKTFSSEIATDGLIRVVDAVSYTHLTLPTNREV